ncbi:MAG: outer membrane protein assembly factor BamC [Bordetella sp.]
MSQSLRRPFVVAALFSSLSVLVGCSTITGANDIDYQSARPVDKPLEVPPDLITPSRDERFSVPASGSASRSQFERQQGSRQQVPSASGVLPAMSGMEIRRIGVQTVLVVNQPAERLWPVVRQFWVDSGFVIAQEDPAIGYLETEWAEDRSKIPEDFIRKTIGRVFDRVYDTGLRDMFRIRLERLGAQQTEISLVHRGLQEVIKGDGGTPTWTNRASDPQLEETFLRRLMVKLGANEDQTAGLVAQGQKAADNFAQMTNTNGLGLIQLAEPFDRAWRRVGVAIDRLGFSVEDRDRSKGLFYIRYRDPTQEAADNKGFFGRIFAAKPDESVLVYQIQVVEQSGSSQVRVLTQKGEPTNDRNARQLLSVLFDQVKLK